VYDEVRTVEDLPIGWGDEQDGGHYRLHQRGDAALFGYAVGPHSWKKFLYPARQRLWQAERQDGDFRIVPEEIPQERWAFLGVRSCELHALGILDRVFGSSRGSSGQKTGPPDPRYASGRAAALIIAVQCAEAGGTCFCVSMQTGPRATQGFDLALTEILQSEQHWFLVETGSETGMDLVHQLVLPKAQPGEIAAALAVSERTAAHMGRQMEAQGVKELLARNYDHPRWDDVAQRCLTCGNCTLVCPTCFCTTVEDTSDLNGNHAERWRQWDSCFTLDFSYIHGGSVRHSARSRYRQWMTHKLSTWFDQFGTSGCVGCGRCITWCPVGIDITEEVRAIRSTEDSSTTEGHDGDQNA